MTDSNDTPDPVPTQPGAPIVGQTDGTPPPAESDNPLEGMTPEQVDALAARIEQARRNRPPSIAQQLEALQATLSDTTARKDAAVDTRKTARDEADTLEAQLAEIRGTLRRTELVEAATAAGFKNPTVVADLFKSSDGDPVELVKTAAASGAFAMSSPAPSADVGGQGSKTPAGMDPGRAALMAEIKAAQGR